MNLSATIGLLGTLQWYDLKNGSQEWQLLLMSCGIVALGLIVWAAAIRKKKKRRRRRHRHHHHDRGQDEAESTAEAAAPEGTTVSKSERRRRRRSRRDERRNPTLAETGGLPPVRWGSFNDDPEQPPR